MTISCLIFLNYSGGGLNQVTTLHQCTLNGQWSGTSDNVGELQLANLTIDVSAARNFDKPGTGTSPEELLLAAAASCYLITFVTLLSNRHIPYKKIQLQSIGFVEQDSGLRFDRIEHHPTVYVEQGVPEDTVVLLANHAEHACMVSSALRGNVDVVVHPKLAFMETVSKGNQV